MPPAVPVEVRSGPVGRASERAELAAFVEGAHPGDQRVLVLAGMPGSGKTTLLGEATQRAVGTVRLARPVEQESQLRHAVLGDLLDGWDLGDAAGLTDAQQLVLRGVLTGEPPPRGTTWRIVATTLLVVLRGAAARGPVLLVVDDVQWADEGSLRVLAYAVRRAPANVRMLAAVRTPLAPGLPPVPGGMLALEPRLLTLGEMPRPELAELLREAFPGMPAPRVREVVDASGANPFVALSLARLDSPAGRLDPHMALDAVTGGAVDALGPDAVQAAEAVTILQVPTLALLGQVLGPETLDGSGLTDALAAAEKAGVLHERDGVWEFTHPLFRAAVSHRIPASRRRRLHLAAAVVVGGIERARHLASGMTEPDVHIAAELAAEAGRAGRRGSPDIAVELWRAALRCTPHDQMVDLYERWSALADVLLHLDRGLEARDAARHAVLAAPDVDARCRSRALEAQAARGLEGLSVHNTVLEEALALSPSPDCEIALLEQLLPAVADAGHTDRVGHLLARLDAVAHRATPPMAARARATRVLLDFQEGRLGGDAALAELGSLVDAGGTAVEDAGNNIAMWVGHSEVALAGWQAILEDLATIGDLATSVEVLQYRTDYDLRLGQTQRARETLDGALAEALTGVDASDAFTHELRARASAHAGDVSNAHAEAARCLALAGDAAWLTSRGHAVTGLADLVAGRTGAAVAAFDRAVAADPGLLTWRHGVCFVAVDRVEALVVHGDVASARVAAKQLTEQANRWGDGWALAAAARSRALVLLGEGNPTAACDAARTAVELSEGQPFRPDLARALLVAGTAARRTRRLKVARQLLDRSAEIFASTGHTGWLPHVETELSRIGGRVASTGVLTSSEVLVARLVAEGHSNREVAERLSLSVRTVESHLSRAYAKLGVTSRTGLSRHLTDHGPPGGQSAVEPPMT